MHPVIPGKTVAPLLDHNSFAALSLGHGSCKKVTEDSNSFHECLLQTGTLQCIANIKNSSQVVCVFDTKPGNCTADHPCSVRFPISKSA